MGNSCWLISLLASDWGLPNIDSVANTALYRFYLIGDWSTNTQKFSEHFPVLMLVPESQITHIHARFIDELTRCTGEK